MDRKSILIVVVAVLLLVLMSPVVDHFFPPKPMTPEMMAALTNQATVAPANAVNGVPAREVVSPTMAPRKSSAPEQTLALSTPNLIFQFTSQGGGVSRILLQRYPALIMRTNSANVPNMTNISALNTDAPLPVLDVLGVDSRDNDNYTLTKTAKGIRAEKMLTNGLHLVKDIELGTNELFTAHVRFENTSAKSILVPSWELVTGTASPIGPMDDPTTLGTFWYNGLKAENVKSPWFANHALGCAILPSTPRELYQEGTNNVYWSAVHNQFFALAAIPAKPAPQILIRPVYLPPPAPINGMSNATTAYLTNGYQSSFGYPTRILQANQVYQEDYTFYAGPKEYKVLSKIGQQMDNKLDLIMDFSGPIGFFSKLLLLSMNGLNAVGLNYGWAIIGITIIIKLIFWPLTRAATQSQKRMQALQPEMKAIADKYKDDPVKKNQKTMEFMKENKVSPLGSCLPTLIQIPVFIGFYWMLRNAIELRGAHFLWAHDLSQPDTVGFIGGFPINLFPLIMGATQLWQAQMMPPAAGMDPAQQKIMRYMPLMFVVMLYRMSAGLTLYWTVQNLLSILQTKLTKMGDTNLKPLVPVRRKG